MKLSASAWARLAQDAEARARDRLDREREEREMEEKHWHSVHDADELNQLIYEIAMSQGGTEDLAQYLAAVMRAPKECHAKAVEDLRQMLLRWAARIDGEV